MVDGGGFGRDKEDKGNISLREGLVRGRLSLCCLFKWRRTAKILGWKIANNQDE
jgi:hypothetical protein